MSIKKKLFSVVCAFILTFSLAGCSDTTWVNKVNDEKLNAGIYLYYITEGYNKASTTLSQTDTSVTDDNIFTKTIENKDVATYISDYAVEQSKRYAAIRAKFKELGLTLSEKEVKDISKAVNDSWDTNQKILEHMGISQASIKLIFETQQMENSIFKKYYFKDGINAVSDDDYKNEIVKTYTRVKMLQIILKQDDGTAFTAEQKSTALKEAEGYLDRVVNGEDFDEMIDKYFEDRYANSGLDTTIDKTDKFRNEQILYEGYQYVDATDLAKMQAIEEFNKPTILKGEQYYYVVEKLDILQRDDLLDDLYDNTISKMKKDEFDSMVKDWSSALSYEENKAATERYAAKDVIKKYVKFNKNNPTKTNQ